MPVLSIIIPCYNSAEYLTDALNSINRYKHKEIFEVIIVNDGSTDAATLELLNKLEGYNYIILHQRNKGPAAARNAAIVIAKGEYLLFLDSDNKIKPKYIDEGIKILETKNDIGIVYANAIFFGETSSARFKSQKFTLPSILHGNYVDMCCLMRKKVWEKLGGFDENKVVIGHEDWEFWIRAGFSGVGFYFIDKFLFYYRVRASSLINKALVPNNYEKFKEYIYKKHYIIFKKFYLKEANREFPQEDGRDHFIRSLQQYNLSPFKILSVIWGVGSFRCFHPGKFLLWNRNWLKYAGAYYRKKPLHYSF